MRLVGSLEDAPLHGAVMAMAIDSRPMGDIGDLGVDEVREPSVDVEEWPADEGSEAMVYSCCECREEPVIEAGDEAGGTRASPAGSDIEPGKLRGGCWKG
ncbi:hypothetical protein HGRIS_004248 [Hohenbuehelia grisea]|uniref:Uncharacterized protein n=1 Tax=Hohenbuehelia grisea TaxID=104357 RepID=A0ABR3IP79_9AGAR